VHAAAKTWLEVAPATLVELNSFTCNHMISKSVHVADYTELHLFNIWNWYENTLTCMCLHVPRSYVLLKKVMSCIVLCYNDTMAYNDTHKQVIEQLIYTHYKHVILILLI
jgi:hypothetical protein